MSTEKHLPARVDDVWDDLTLAADELNRVGGYDSTSLAAVARPVVRVLGSIAVTLALMLDHMKNGPMR